MEQQKTIFMPKKLLKKWLKALRTPVSKGGYRQARETLHDPKTGGFCCLGVLQHVATGGEVEVDSQGYFEVIPSVEWLNKHGIVFKGAYGDKQCPYLPSLKVDAAEANDSGRSFRKIADAIEDCAVGT